MLDSLDGNRSDGPATAAESDGLLSLWMDELEEVFHIIVRLLF